MKEARGGPPCAGVPAWHDPHVTDPSIPEDLIELKRRFYTAEQELAELAAHMPPSMAVSGGEQEISEADRAAWDALWRAQDELVQAIHRHPTFEGLNGPERFKLDEAASKAARASI